MSRIRFRSISGSLLVTGSVSGNTLTFEKGDGTSFDLRVDTGSGAVATDITDLNNYTGSANTRFDNLEAATGSYLISDDTGSLVYSGSFDGVSTLTLYLPDGNLDLDLSALTDTTADISALNTFTGSAESRLDSIESKTGSYATTGSNQFTGSQFFSGSLIPEATGASNGIYDLGSQTHPWRDLYLTTASLKFVKDGEIFSTLSGERDAVRVGNVLITTSSLAFVNNNGDVVNTIATAEISGSDIVGGQVDDLPGIREFTGSAESRLDSIEGATGSYVTNDQTGSFLVGSDTGSLLITGSVSSNVITLEKADGTSFSLTVNTGSGQAIPDGTVSSSAQIEAVITDNYISASAAASGFGTGGSDTDLSALNTFTGSAESRLGSIEAVTSSFLVGSDTGSLLTTASIVSNTITLEKADGTSFNITVDTGSNALTASFVETLSNFNGDRIVSNTDLPSGIYNTNFGTSGSLSNFIERVFFPNTSPSISASLFRVEEFVVSGSSIGTVSATDAEGQTITFSTASSYTDDLFRIHSGSGEITLNTKSTASMNTVLTPDAVATPASQSHAFTVEATDTFGGTTSAIIYIHVNANNAPVWRQTSITGTAVNTFSQSLNENSVSGNNKARVFFTDPEGDVVTINTGSLSSTFTDAFSLTVESTYVQLNQVTASLDFETTSTYEFVLTASDEHYQDGDDTDAIAYLPFHIAVQDNTGPSVNDQSLSGVNENSANGASVGSISATDPEGDTIVFSNFTLVRAFVNGVGTNVTGSMGGTGLSDPTADAFQTDINGNVTRKNSVFLNADIADRYEYRVTVADAFNTTTDTGLITIPISDDAASTIGADGQNFYIVESAEQSDNLTTETNGFTPGNVTLSSAVTQRWEINTVPSGFARFTTGNTYATASSVTLEVDSNISGSSNTSGDTIAIQITASEDAFFTTKQFRDHTLNITTNSAPDIIFTNTSANLNTNGARPSNTLTTITFNDVEGDALDHTTFQFTDPSGQLEAVQSSDSYLVRATSNLSSSVYAFSASIKDEHGFNTNEELHSVTVAQAPIGSLTTNGTFYVIESALNGANIVLNSNGRTGTQGDLGVSYSPTYNSAAVQSFTSSNAAIVVDSSGGLTLGLNLSGSATGSGATIASDITFRDQYNNIGSGSITINVAENQAPTAVFTDQSAKFETNFALTGVTMVSMSISDTESDTPFSASLSGTNASDLQIVYGNAASSSAEIQAATDLAAGTYNYNVQVTDNFNKSRDYNGRSFTIAQSEDYGKVYLYDVGFNNVTYNTAVGITSEDGSTPPVATPFSNIGFVDAIINDNRIGSSSFDYTYGSSRTATLLASGSETNVHDTLRAMGSSGTIARNSSIHFVILMPSGSDLSGIPLTMRDSYGGSTLHEYVLEVGTDGTTIDGTNTIEASEINQFDLATDHLGYTTWFMVGAANQVASSTNFNLGLNPSSGSGGA
jgi:hypothetical protein